MTNATPAKTDSPATVPTVGLTRAEKIALWFLSGAAFVIMGYLYALHGDVRNLQGQSASAEQVLGTMDARIGEFKDRFVAMGERFDRIDSGLVEIKSDLQDASALIKGVMSRQYVAEADPENLAAQMGYTLGSGYKARFVENRLYLFPQTAEAEKDLVKDGRFARVKLSPVLYGYEIRKVADALGPPGANGSQ